MKLPLERSVLATTTTFALAAFVGALGGAIGIGFQALVDGIQALVVGRPGSFADAVAGVAAWQRFLLPAAGGLAAALVIRVFAPTARPFGISGIMEAVSVRRRRMRGRPIVVRASGSALLLGCGASLGREGPIVQLAALSGSKIARWAGLDPRRHALLLGCGTAAGMAAAYNAPLAGAFFVMEVIVASFAIDVFAPLVVSSVFAALVLHAVRGADAAVYQMPAGIHVSGVGPVLLALVLGIPAGAVSALFQRILRATGHAFAQIRLPLEAKLVLSGLIVGAVGLFLPEIYGNGYSPTSSILAAKLSLGVVVSLLLLKPICTALTVGSGAPGGVFTPTILTGAAFGALFGAAGERLFPDLGVPPAAFPIIGMAAMIAGTTHAPIMSMLMLVELTHDFSLVLPLMLATVASSLSARYLLRDSIFTASLRARGVPVDAGIEELVLRRIRVRDLVRSGAASVSVRAPLPEILQRFRDTRLDVVYVVEDDGEFRGRIDLHDVKDFLNRSEAGPPLIASDLAETPPTADPEMSLAAALELFDDPELEELPIVDARAGRPILIGRLTRRDVMAAIHLEVVQNQTRRSRLVLSDEDRGEVLELPKGWEIAELTVPRRHKGGTLRDTGIAQEKGITVLSLVEESDGRRRRTVADPDAALERIESLVVMGRREDIEALRQRAQREM